MATFEPVQRVDLESVTGGRMLVRRDPRPRPSLAGEPRTALEPALHTHLLGHLAEHKKKHEGDELGSAPHFEPDPPACE